MSLPGDGYSIFMTRKKQLPFNGPWAPSATPRVGFSGSSHLVSDVASQLGCSHFVSTLVGELPPHHRPQLLLPFPPCLPPLATWLASLLLISFD